ncbi:lipocalin family protein [Motilimonas pumila]|uniref:Outer membrane lipoprotein Blc n=1 Tax=Motilimonas pumila TaxID=2303987 RepID=A0A418YDM5_9GAMM|nr:lipocalin family protein [Motilimonas pumila]RJG42590.1 lipocalin [Motilimonas pumila]
MKKLLRLCSTFALSSLMLACTGLPEGVTPVSNFDSQQYLGKWYEVARLDHSFERGMSHVTATYSMREDGGIRVLNQGYAQDDRKWQQAEGKAYFVDNEDTGHLKVSFFGPFYGSYAVFDLEKDYQYAFIAGNTTSYLWLLARSPQVSEAVKQDFIQQATQLGFATEEIIWVDQNQPAPQ